MKNKLTKKQLSFILFLLSKLPPEKVVKITNSLNKDIQNLSKREASALIKKLLKEFKRK